VVQRQSIWCAILACLSSSSNQTNEIDQSNQIDQTDQINQMNQIPALRRVMLDCTT
jgi:hypothetical protein